MRLRRGRLALGILLAIIGVALLAAAGVLALRPHHAAEPTGTTIAIPGQPGQVIHLDTQITPELAAKQQAVPTYNGLQLTIPALSFTVPLGAINVADGQLTPPGIWSAYWVRNLGVAPEHAAQGTVFLVIHTVRGDATAPGNLLINPQAGHSAVVVGDRITIGTHTYQVTRTANISRDDLPYNREVWTSRPGTMVLITCLERPDSTVVLDNVVVWATLV